MVGADGQVSTGTSSAWTFTEIMTKYDTNGGNRTGVGSKYYHGIRSATISVGMEVKHIIVPSWWLLL